MPDWLARSVVGEPLPPHVWPRWARHFRTWCLWRPYGPAGAGALVCLVCDVALVVPAVGMAQNPAAALAGWRHHGLLHDMAGDLPEGPGSQGPA